MQKTDKMGIPAVIFGICAAIGLIWQNEIKDATIGSYHYVMGIITKQIIIETERNPKLVFAIKQEIIANVQQYNKMVVNDGSNNPIYGISNGKYVIGDNKIRIEVKDEEICVYKYTLYASGMDVIKDFVWDTYKKYCSTDENLMYFTSDGDKWSFPIFRKPRNVEKMENNVNIKTVMEDLDNFFNIHQQYIDDNMPYRRGYLLEGKPGCGKSTTIEAMAIKHNMDVYLINLNSKDMTDTVLINLISRVYEKSIIVFEEIDKQLETLRKNANNQISFGGILSAIDGPQRLSDSCIVVMTTNNIEYFTESEKGSLCRKGRIDETFKFR